MTDPYQAARKALADHYRGLRRRIGTRAARAHWKIDQRGRAAWMRAWDAALYEVTTPTATKGGLADLIADNPTPRNPPRKTPRPR